MFSVTTIVLLSTLCFLNLAQQTDVCPPNLIRDRYLQVRGNLCYEFVVYRQVTHNVAKAYCQRNGGTLALIKNLETQNYLYRQLLHTYGLPTARPWIGLSDSVRENHYVWDDNTISVFTHWAAGEGPTATADHEPHDCVVMDIAAAGKWRDVSCGADPDIVPHEAHIFICQYHVHVELSTVSHSQTSVTTTDEVQRTTDEVQTTTDEVQTTSETTVVIETTTDGEVQSLFTDNTSVSSTTCPSVVCSLGCSVVKINTCPECSCDKF